MFREAILVMRRRKQHAVTCRACVHFLDDPAIIEDTIPKLTMLGSAYSSARGEAGLCNKRGLFLDPMEGALCETFTPRTP